jgi:hypothetical protein
VVRVDIKGWFTTYKILKSGERAEYHYHRATGARGLRRSFHAEARWHSAAIGAVVSPIPGAPRALRELQRPTSGTSYAARRLAGSTATTSPRKRR